MRFKENFKKQLDTEVQAWIEKIDEELCKAIKSDNNLDVDSNSLSIYFREIVDIFAVYLGEHNDFSNKIELGRIRKSVFKELLPHLEKEGFKITKENSSCITTCKYEL